MVNRSKRGSSFEPRNPEQMTFRSNDKHEKIPLNRNFPEKSNSTGMW